MKKRIPIILIITFIALMLLGFFIHNKPEKEKEKEPKTLLNVTTEKLIEETKKEILEEPIERTTTIMYVSSLKGINIREFATTDSNIIATVTVNTELEVYDDFELDGWYMVKYNDNDYYVWSEYLSTELTEIPEPVYYKPTSYNHNESYNDNVIYSASQFKSMGVINWNNTRWTWYSQKVLAGGGLNISGRHVDENGFVCDGEGYICLSSSTLSKGTVIGTPFGKNGKVYDSGCAVGTIDVYTNF